MHRRILLFAGKKMQYLFRDPKRDLQGFIVAKALPACLHSNFEEWVFVSGKCDLLWERENWDLVFWFGALFFPGSFDWQEMSTYFNYIWPFYNMTKLSNRCLLWVREAWTYDREANNNSKEFCPSCFLQYLVTQYQMPVWVLYSFEGVTLPTSMFWIWSPLMASKE